MRCVLDEDNHWVLMVWRARGYPALAHRLKLMLLSTVIVTPTAIPHPQLTHISHATTTLVTQRLRQ